MEGLLAQLLILLAVLRIIVWGYQRWIRHREVGIQVMGMLLLTVVTLVGGLVMLMLSTYLAPLLVTIPLFHLDPAAPITYGLIWAWPGDLLTSRHICRASFWSSAPPGRRPPKHIQGDENTSEDKKQRSQSYTQVRLRTYEARDERSMKAQGERGPLA